MDLKHFLLSAILLVLLSLADSRPTEQNNTQNGGEVKVDPETQLRRGKRDSWSYSWSESSSHSYSSSSSYSYSYKSSGSSPVKIIIVGNGNGNKNYIHTR
ncbi:unnamed protein product [Leptosia nina]|uniref:Uncharacterized protein n=1 Tax=Leptosia nina TaxID=320188 RepID=A0AAV1JSZ6_9NEOP